MVVAIKIIVCMGLIGFSSLDMTVLIGILIMEAWVAILVNNRVLDITLR